MKTMNKVFWQFPSIDNTEQWKRLDPEVQKQVKWLYDPYRFKEGDDTRNKHPLSKSQREHSEEQYKFAEEYNGKDQMDFTDLLIQHIDMNSSEIWSYDTIKAKKWEIKDNSTYFRLVKQGSILVYLSFHIFTIFTILCAACLRQTILAIIYVLILLPRIRYGAEVLG